MILSPFMPQRYKKFSNQATFNAKKVSMRQKRGETIAVPPLIIIE